MYIFIGISSNIIAVYGKITVEKLVKHCWFVEFYSRVDNGKIRTLK